MTVQFIRPTDSGKRIKVGIIEDGVKEAFSVKESEAQDLYVGMELDPDTYDRLYRSDEEYRCMRYALYSLSVSDKTRSNLYMKLLKKGFSRECASECVKECLRLGYIDEERQVHTLVLNEANRSLRGAAYITAKLVGKGYSRELVVSVIEELSRSGEIDFRSNFERLCEKKGIATDEEKRAIAYKFGYRI